MIEPTPAERARMRAAQEDHPEVAAGLNARIVIVATVVVGQLWGLTVALDAWMRSDATAVWWVLGFQTLSFAVALAVWLSGPRPR